MPDKWFIKPEVIVMNEDRYNNFEKGRQRRQKPSHESRFAKIRASRGEACWSQDQQGRIGV